MSRLLIHIVFLSLAINSGIVYADIFRMEDEEGNISFTDTPNSKSYTLILRESVVKTRRTRESAAKLSSIGPRVNPPTVTPGEPQINELPIQGIVTSPTGLRIDPIDRKLRHHNGYDIAAPMGTPVKPVAPGTVHFSGWRSGYGNTVIIDHHDGMVTLYAHNSNNLVSEGEQVDRSVVIALSGSTGRSTGPHLHFEAWKNGDNITNSFAPNGAAAQASNLIASTPIKRILQEDGTILFTNQR